MSYIKKGQSVAQSPMTDMLVRTKPRIGVKRSNSKA